MSDLERREVSAQGQSKGKLPTLIACGEHTMATTDEDKVIVGLLATDVVVVGLLSQAGTSDIADLVGICEADNLNIGASAVGDGDGVVSYIVVRPGV